MENGKPDFITDDHLIFLDDLRESGVTNMFGAGPFIEEYFEVDIKRAREILSYWMASFGKTK